MFICERGRQTVRGLIEPFWLSSDFWVSIEKRSTFRILYIYMWNLCFFHVFPHRSLTMAYQHQPINLIFISNAMTFFLQHPATAAARLLLRPGMLYITYIDAKWFIQLQHSSISTINMSISIGSNKIDSLVAECILCHWSVYVFFFLLFF